MTFTPIDKAHWARREYFDHYVSQVPCTYSMTVSLDITRLRQAGRRLYPAMLHALTTAVNRHAEFRTAFSAGGALGVYSDMVPCYTVFHRESETFSNLWTEYFPRYEDFLAAYETDLQLYGDRLGMTGKPGVPENSFPVSMVPWASFEGFNLNLQKGYDYLLPIFTIGRYREEGERTLLPLAAQVHHGVCDGFHLCRFLNDVQELLDQP